MIRSRHVLRAETKLILAAIVKIIKATPGISTVRLKSKARERWPDIDEKRMNCIVSMLRRHDGIRYESNNGEQTVRWYADGAGRTLDGILQVMGDAWQLRPIPHRPEQVRRSPNWDQRREGAVPNELRRTELVWRRMSEQTIYE